MQLPFFIDPRGKLVEGTPRAKAIRALAQAMANPIRRNLDYYGIARKCLVIDQIPQGALTIYDRDPIEKIGDGSEEE